MTTYAYTRASLDKQVMSCDTQVDSVRKAVLAIQEDDPDVNDIGTIIEDAATSGTTPFAERKGGNRLLNTVQPGDVVVVARMGRIARNTLDLLNTVETLRIKGVSLYVLKFLGGACLTKDTTPETRVVMQILASLYEFEREMIAERTREASAYRKSLGLPYGQPCYGMRRVWLDKDGAEVRFKRTNKHRVATRHDVWDQPECDLIREIYRRHMSGESLHSIGKDFYERRLATCVRDKAGNLKLWVTKPANPKRADTLSAGRVYGAYKWYREVVAAGYDIGGLSDDVVDVRVLPRRES